MSATPIPEASSASCALWSPDLAAVATASSKACLPYSPSIARVIHNGRSSPVYHSRTEADHGG